MRNYFYIYGDTPRPHQPGTVPCREGASWVHTFTGRRGWGCGEERAFRKHPPLRGLPGSPRSRESGRTYEKLSTGWPTCEMCTSSRYWKGCSVGKVPAPGGSDSQVPSIQDSGSTTGLILGGSGGERRDSQWLRVP